MGLIDNMAKAKAKNNIVPTQPQLTQPQTNEIKEIKEELERIINLLTPLQRGVCRIEAQQPVKNFEEILQHMHDDIDQLHQHTKMITKDISKQEELEWGENYATLAKINQSIIVEHGRLRPLMLKVVARRTQDPLEDYPELKGRVNIHPDELKGILKKEREFADKVAVQMETYLHHCWRPTVEALVRHVKFLEAFVLDRKTLEGEFRKSLEKQRYEAEMDNIPKSEIEEGDELG